MPTNIHPYLDLADYRRKVADMYRQVRDETIPITTRWEIFRQKRDDLFTHHPQSALTPEQRSVFKNLDYFPYNPAMRVTAPIDYLEADENLEINLQEDGTFGIKRIGKVRFTINNMSLSLSLFWIIGYGGGFFLPFRDQTCSKTTYGGGRYLLDTIKHADLGTSDNELILDFNFSYNPSCAYNSKWDCPLAPPENWLPISIRAGEKTFIGHN